MSEPLRSGRTFDWGKVLPAKRPGEIATYPYTASEWGKMMVRDFPIPLPKLAEKRRG